MNIRQTIGRAALGSMLTLGAVLGLSSSASAAVTFGYVELYADSSASADIVPGSNGYTVTASTGSDDELAFAPTSIAALSYSQQDAISPTKGSQAEGSDSETSLASFTSASSGTAEFVGATTSKVIASGAGAYALSNPEYIVYGFSVDQKSMVSVNYNATSDAQYSDEFPGYSIYLYDPGFNLYIDKEGTGNNVTGTVTSGYIYPGFYYLEFDNSSGNDFSSQSTVGAISSGAQGEFNFNIATVPEPATWAMMLTGFGAMGGALRMSRRKRALAA